MTETTIAEILRQAPAIIIALATLLGTCAGLIVALRNSKKTDTVIEKTGVVIEKAVEIHTLTNGNLSTTMAALAVAQEKILGLEKMIRQIANPRVKPLTRVK